MVLAGRPVASSMRLAARPVGAQSRMRSPTPSRIRTMALMIVVLPVPGPPVITSACPVSARVTAARCGSASAIPHSPSKRLQLGLDVEARGGVPGGEDHPEQLGGGGLVRVEAREIDRLGGGAAVLVAGQRLGAHEPAPVQIVDGVLERLGFDLEQLDGPLHQLAARQVDVPGALGALDERVDQPGLEPLRRLRRQPERAGDGVGGAKTDAEDLLGQPVGVVAHDRDRGVAVLPPDAVGVRRGDPVRLEEQHHLAHGPLLVPGAADQRAPRRPDALDLLEALGRALDDVHRLEPEALDQARGHDLADAPDQPGGEVALHADERRGRHREIPAELELLAEAPVGLPAAGEAQALAGAHPGQQADRGDRPAAALDLEAHDAPAGLFVGEGDRLEHPLEGQIARTASAPVGRKFFGSSGIAQGYHHAAQRSPGQPGELCSSRGERRIARCVPFDALQALPYPFAHECPSSPRRCLPAAVCLLGPALAAAETLTILHLNDFHGALQPTRSGADRPEEGGAARLAALVAAERTPTTLFLAAGDLMQGTNLSNLFAGRPVIEAFNLMGLDASAVGNHEFDNGQPALSERAAEARFPFLAANIAGGGSWQPAVIRKVGSLRVALFGLTTEETPVATHPRNVKGLVFNDAVATARRLVAELRPQADLIVALTHLGVEEDEKLAVAVPGIDVIVGGHTHTKVEQPEVDRRDARTPGLSSGASSSGGWTSRWRAGKSSRTATACSR